LEQVGTKKKGKLAELGDKKEEPISFKTGKN
jgi:hypothetical protein